MGDTEVLRSPEDRGRMPPNASVPGRSEEGVGDSYYETPREVWTESQVLGAMDVIEEESAEVINSSIFIYVIEIYPSVSL